MSELLNYPIVESDKLPDIPPPQVLPFELDLIRIIIWFPKTIRRRFPVGAQRGKGGNVKRYTVYIGHDLLTNKLVVKGERP